MHAIKMFGSCSLKLDGEMLLPHFGVQPKSQLDIIFIFLYYTVYILYRFCYE